MLPRPCKNCSTGRWAKQEGRHGEAKRKKTLFLFPASVAPSFQNPCSLLLPWTKFALLPSFLPKSELYWEFTRGADFSVAQSDSSLSLLPALRFGVWHTNQGGRRWSWHWELQKSKKLSICVAVHARPLLRSFPAPEL